MFQIIPAIDILNGQVVRLTQGDYNKATIYSDDPAGFAKKFETAGAQWIHLVDLDGAKTGHPVNLPTVQKIRQTVKCKLELGGGIRTLNDAATILNTGVTRIILGSVALKNKTLTKTLVETYGGEEVIVGIDAKNGKVAVEGWLEDSSVSALELLQEMEKIGVQTVIYTDIAKDGMLSGIDAAMYKDLHKKTKIKIIASGGIASLNDIKALRDSGVAGVIVGKALYERKFTVEELFSC